MIYIESLLLVASFLFPFLLFITLFLDSSRNLSRKIMTFVLFNTTLIFLANYFYFQQIYSVYIPIHSLHAGLELCIFPAIYLYVKLIGTPNMNIKNEWTHFLPAIIVFIIASLIFYVYAGKGDLIFFLKRNREHFQFLEVKYQVLVISRYIHLALIVMQAIFYGVKFVNMPKEYNEQLKNEFSSIENFSIDWINMYNLSLAIITFFGLIFYGFIPLYGYQELFIVFVFFCLSSFVCAMGLISRKQRMSEINLDEFELVIDNQYNTAVNERILMLLEDHMEKNQAFLQPDLCLTNVSKVVGTNRTYLSAIINRQYGLNFNAYVNQYRVKYINEYIKENPTIRREELVKKGGFGSLSTMQRAMSRANDHN